MCLPIVSPQAQAWDAACGILRWKAFPSLGSREVWFLACGKGSSSCEEGACILLAGCKGNVSALANSGYV